MEFKHLALQALLLLQISLPTQILCFNNCKFPAIFNFGDSNSDTGGLSAAFGQAPFPNGQTYFHAPAGRFCDGRLLRDWDCPISVLFLIRSGQISDTELISQLPGRRSGLRIQPFPRVDLVRFLSMFSMFSTRILSKDRRLFEDKSLLDPKSDSSDPKIMGTFRNLLPEEDYFSRALYAFDIGQNDLTAGYKLNLSTQQVKAYVPHVLAQFSTVIKLLYARGGRSFWIHNTGPVGCLPYIMDRFLVTAAQIDRYGCSSPYNEVSKYFNLRLKDLVLQLRKELPLAAITYVDVYSVKYTLISQAKKLGFENPFLACCGHGGKYNYNRFNKCGSKKIINGTKVVLAKSCKDPSVRISWDGTHFTEAANRWIFDRIADGSFSDPPVSLEFACNKDK